MPKKALKKKKLFKRACYQKAREGKINQADGSFRVIQSSDIDGMTQGYKAGYKL